MMVTTAAIAAAANASAHLSISAQVRATCVLRSSQRPSAGKSPAVSVECTKGGPGAVIALGGAATPQPGGDSGTLLAMVNF